MYVCYFCLLSFFFFGFFVALSKMLPAHTNCHALKAEDLFCLTLWSTTYSFTKAKGSTIELTVLNSAQRCLSSLGELISIFERYIHKINSINNGPGISRIHIFFHLMTGS